MEFKVLEWKIGDLIKLYDEDKINLSPPYQRKNVWSLNDQKLLINSIKSNWPMPNFFILSRPDGSYEMVDGQQRSRTIIGYWHGKFADYEGVVFSDTFKTSPSTKQISDKYSKYKLTITNIVKLENNESIHEFYTLVNSAGLHLNRPELKKAEYFETRFLKLITELANNESLQKLNLFTKTTLDRMNDIDFVSELVALLEYGVSDKKEMVDAIYEADISVEKYDSLRSQFNEVITIFDRFNALTPLKSTRYRQKNDFYSLFYFIHKHKEISTDVLNYFYKLLVKIAPQIKPSQENCEPLMTYAINCVTQSNSKTARSERDSFLKSLLLNESKQPNDVQLAIMKLFRLRPVDVVRLSKYTLPDLDKMQSLEE